MAQGGQPNDIVADDIANYVRDLEQTGLETAETGLCDWATQAAATQFCDFVVGTPVVQWVSNKLLNLPVVAQVTHQIATKAAGAAEAVAHVVQSSIQVVVDAVNTAKDVVQAAASAATNIVHAVLNFFGWLDKARLQHYKTITMQFPRVPHMPKALRVKSKPEDELIV